MIIALIRRSYTPFGGAERYMARLVAGLSAAGHRVHILASNWKGPESDDVTFHRIPAVRKPGWLALLGFIRGCRQLIRRECFDVVFSLERTLCQDIYRAGDGCHRQWLALKHRHNPLTALLTRLNPIQALTLAIERRLYCDPDLKAIIANSRQGKEDIIRLYGVAPERIHVVYNGIEPVATAEADRCQARQQLENEFAGTVGLCLLYVGSGFRRKGAATAIAAAAKLAIPFTLFVVGKERRLGHYRRLAQHLGVADHVIFTGPRTDVNSFYNGCDLFVFPTLYDPFSNATLEAMAHGLPVITSRYNGVAELIEQGVNGFVIDDPEDAATLADRIMELADDGRRHAMAERAACAAAPFTMERNIRETMAVITRVLSEKTGDMCES